MALAQQTRQPAAITMPVTPGMTDRKLVIIGMPETDPSILAMLAGIFGWRGMEWPGSSWSACDESIDDRHDIDQASQRIEQHIRNLPDRTFLLGHIPHSEIALTALASFRKVLLVRELRSVLVSRFQVSRFQADRDQPSTAIASSATDRSDMCRFLRQQGPLLFGQFLSILTWMAEKDVVISHVEDLQRVDQAAARQLSKALGIKGRSANVHAHADAMSAAEIKLERFWSDAAEDLFNAFGGCLWNSALGYDQPYMVTEGADDSPAKSGRPHDTQHRSH
jgi:hypothetical protein